MPVTCSPDCCQALCFRLLESAVEITITQQTPPFWRSGSGSSKLEINRKLKLPGVPPRVGRLKPPKDARLGPKSACRSTTLDWFRRLNPSATKSSFPCSPTVKYLKTRRSIDDCMHCN